MTTLTIQTQYYENYNVGPDGFNTYGDKQPHWKPKGGFEFVIENFDADYLFYDEVNTIEAIKKLISNQETVAAKFEYISHEVSFKDPVTLKNEEFLTCFNDILDTTSVKMKLK